LSLLRARAQIACGDPETALRCAEEGIANCDESDVDCAALHNAAGQAAELLDQRKKASRSFSAACELTASSDGPWDAAEARAGKARQLGAADDFVAAAAAFGEEARVLEHAGLSNGTARALARRAVCMAQAGATDQAIKELQRAAERLSGGEEPVSSVLESRMLMGRVFRFAGKREQAKKALAMAAETAALHAAADIEGQARLGLARLFLEGMPAQGAGRGEALRDSREAAEAVLKIARTLADHPLEALAEGILGELSYRAEDWDGALSSLSRQEQLWKSGGRVGEQVDVALRRARVAARCERWEDSLSAADSALALASRRRLHELAAQAQLLRGETLQSLDKSADALAAFSEAERLYSSLGSAFTSQAAAASERARQAVG
jgi:tetratricopeptide (TPR) repeat protein